MAFSDLRLKRGLHVTCLLWCLHLVSECVSQPPSDGPKAAPRGFNFGLNIGNPFGFGLGIDIGRPSPDRPGGVGVDVNVGRPSPDRPGGVGVDVNVGRPSPDRPGGVGVDVNVGRPSPDRPGGVGVDVNVGRPSPDRPGGVGVGVNVGGPSADRPSGVNEVSSSTEEIYVPADVGNSPVMYYETSVNDAVSIIRHGFGQSQVGRLGHALCLNQDIASIQSHHLGRNPKRLVILKVKINLPRDQVIPNNLGMYCILDSTKLQPIEVMEAPGLHRVRLENLLERMAERH
ncbi:uncharacterized protein LOC115097514 [Rhinatrema bivittatum]|uniref:uncharacterized protein LOC115097514 n=1 Tax=Rhinatrema bivittatum TaxID=194408 RepID=UPI00112696A9|nr:uncharacterized protein LOC115097514 [Rhinatrema bivittatum]